MAKTASAYFQRSTDFFARYGGEEFVAFLMGGSTEKAFAHLKQVRQAVEDLHIPHDPSVSQWVTVSIGGVTGHGGNHLVTGGMPECVVEPFEVVNIKHADGERHLEADGLVPLDHAVTDVIMPGMDGFTLLKKLQEEVITQSVPVILITGRLVPLDHAVTVMLPPVGDSGQLIGPGLVLHLPAVVVQLDVRADPK